jgi:uncharacterized protein (TIGR02466 family)|tara:strand:+ start:1266 stop:1847 length:582 start_codon:yes stop_codon:yes gene_type:complete
MIREEFFPTSIYGKDVRLNNQELAQHIIKWSQQDEGLNKTNVKGWHSQTDMHTKPEYKALADELFIFMKDIWKEEWLDKEPVLGNMWANINYQGGYNRPHVHPNALFSGAYYIKTPPNCGQLICTDPRPGIQTVMPSRVKGTPPKHLWRECHLEVKEGRIIIFPAWLWHSVPPSESNDIRISVSFNFIQQGFQ